MTQNNLLTNPLIIRQIADYYLKTKREDKWNLFVATSEKPQRKYRAKMREIFANQLDDILESLNRKSIKADESIGYINEDQLCDWNQYRIIYNEFGQLELPGIMTTWASLELEALELGISFDVTDPNALTAITNRANLFSDSVVNKTRDRLHKVVADSIQAGDGIPQLEKKIRLLYANMSKFRAYRIARSEVIWGQNEGAEQSYIQSGVIEAKSWLCAHDERLCFTADTQIETEQDLQSINKIKIGDIVNTHEGMKKVVQVMVSKRTGRMIKIDLDNGQDLICTPDHPIFEIDKGWKEAEQLDIGDKLQTSKNEVVKIANLSYLKFFKTYNYISKLFKFPVLSTIFNLIIMPIFAVNLKADTESGQIKVNTIMPDLKFLDKLNFQSFKRFSDYFFNGCFANIFSIAREGTKSFLFKLGWANSKLFSTFKTFCENSRSATGFRTIFKPSVFVIKDLSADGTGGYGFETMPTSQTTNSISVSGRFWNGETFMTYWTGFNNHIRFLRCPIASVGTKIISQLNCAWWAMKNLTTMHTNNITSLSGIRMVALTRTIDFVKLGLKFFTTKFTNHILHLSRYYNIFVKWCQSYNVYNIEVEDAHTYFANGVLVHNCPWCAEMGRRDPIPVGTNYFNKGDVWELPKPEKGLKSIEVTTDHGKFIFAVYHKYQKADTIRYEFNYEDIRHPPLHPYCRCCLIPIIMEAGKMYGWFGAWIRIK